MTSRIERKLIVFSYFLFHLPTVLKGSSGIVEDHPPPSTVIIDAAKLNKQANYFQETPSSAVETVLKTYNNISLVQCTLRCKRNNECVDVAFNDDKVCLLLGRKIDGAQINAGLKKISVVKFPGLLIYQKSGPVCYSQYIFKQYL